MTGPTEPADRDGAAGQHAARLTALVEGYVQGVGFRMWVRRQATGLGLVGVAANLADGRVEVIAEGDETACRELLGLMRGDDAPGLVTTVAERWTQPQGRYHDFATQLRCEAG